MQMAKEHSLILMEVSTWQIKKVMSMYRILIPFIIFVLFHFSCSKEKEEEKKSETLGSKNGAAVYMAGYD